jgi:hypothetical protein
MSICCLGLWVIAGLFARWEQEKAKQDTCDTNPVHEISFHGIHFILG